MSRGDAPWREVGFGEAGGLLVRIPASVASAAGAVAQAYAPLETGGLLLGRYTAQRTVLTVTEALPPPPDSMHGRTSFVRGEVGLLATIARARAEDASVFVVGEWHTHPAHAPSPSSVDHRGMKWFARRGLYGCRSPVLLILGMDLGPSAPWSVTAYRRWRGPVPLVRSW